MCDYATRYPEAIPLKKFTTPAIAEELVELFARHGIPKEILTDQGTNFTSQLFLELYRMLGVKAIRTTPYHPQTDGLVERFNQTLKQMLRKTIDEEGREWDKLLPYVLFAYREVPQSSTGFSPFELIYGRDVRGPLDVLKEDWIHNQLKDDDIVSYVTRIYERLKEGREAVQENLRKSQLKQKKWYDKRARDITLAEGDKVLVLLPTRTEKLLAKWKGPYKVLRKVGRVNYEIEVPGGRKEKKLFHVNMLKPWTNPEENFVNYIPDEQDELPCFVRDVQQGKSDLKLGESLSEVKKKQMTKLVGEFPMLTRLQPGKTHVIEHRIITDAQGPVRQRAYRIPPALTTEVVEELKELLDAGVVEESTSEWSSPIVVVKKKDGTNRICVDYQKLNATSKFDAYPMPRIDEMLDAVGQSEYLTTLDLTKGYWQVPMKEEDKTKTAFSSPLGLLQFTVMPLD